MNDLMIYSLVDGWVQDIFGLVNMSLISLNLRCLSAIFPKWVNFQ